MKWLLLFSLLGTGAVIVAVCLVVLLIRYRLVRRNRVRPAVSTGAPMLWLVSPQSAARLHRRLVTAGAAARAVAARHQPPGRKRRRDRAEPPPIVELCQQLEAQAEDLDRHLTVAGRLPASQRRAVLLRITESVGEIERAAARLSTMSAELGAPRVLPHEQQGVAELAAKLDSLEAAEHELRALEAGAGLDWSTPFGAAAERQPAPVEAGWPAAQPAPVEPAWPAAQATPVETAWPAGEPTPGEAEPEQRATGTGSW